MRDVTLPFSSAEAEAEQIAASCRDLAHDGTHTTAFLPFRFRLRRLTRQLIWCMSTYSLTRHSRKEIKAVSRWSSSTTEGDATAHFGKQKREGEWGTGVAIATEWKYNTQPWHDTAVTDVMFVCTLNTLPGECVMRKMMTTKLEMMSRRKLELRLRGELIAHAAILQWAPVHQSRSVNRKNQKNK